MSKENRARGLLIVPAYNEAASIAGVVHDLKKHVPAFDVVVIDDGSTDATAANVPQGARVIRLPFNLGIGGAMQTGYRCAAMEGYEVAVQVDGDGQHRGDQVSKLIDRLEAGGADLVIGSRFLGAGEYHQSAARAAGSGVLRAMLRLLTGRAFTDCTSGFRAANRSIIEAFAHWYPEDYPEPEVVLLLCRAGFNIVEVEVSMNTRAGGRSSIPFTWGVFYVIKVATSLLLDTIRQPWPEGK